MPGEGARAIDNFRKHCIEKSEWGQAFSAAQNHLYTYYGNGEHEDYNAGFATLISYLAGYAAGMPLEIAFEGARLILHERYGLKDE